MMNKNYWFIIFSLFLFCLQEKTYSQSYSFHKFYFYQANNNQVANYYSGNSITQTADKGFIIGGAKNYTDLMLFKTNSHGDTLWVKTYGGSGGVQECMSVKAT